METERAKLPECHATKSASKIFKIGSNLSFCFFSVSVTNFCWNKNEIYRKKHAETEQKWVTVAHCWLLISVNGKATEHLNSEGICKETIQTLQNRLIFSWAYPSSRTSNCRRRRCRKRSWPKSPRSRTEWAVLPSIRLWEDDSPIMVCNGHFGYSILLTAFWGWLLNFTCKIPYIYNQI